MLKKEDIKVGMKVRVLETTGTLRGGYRYRFEAEFGTIDNIEHTRDNGTIVYIKGRDGDNSSISSWMPLTALGPVCKLNRRGR